MICADKNADEDKATLDFRIYTSGDLIPDVTFYFVEGTAPDNVEERANSDDAPPKDLKSIDPDVAVAKIAETLAPANEPEVEADLVVMVHGFNTPRDKARDFFAAAAKALENDQNAIFTTKRRIVCIGYRWPSEAMFGKVFVSSPCAMPLFPRGLFFLAIAVLLTYVMVWAPGFLMLVAVAVVAAIVGLALLRATVYFRDIYRATNYGAPDLVDVIRQIDLEISKRVDAESGEIRAKRRRIALSFIGHSMGGLVVTNTIRVLSDVFDREVITTYLSGKRREEFPIASSAGRGDESSEGAEEGPDDTLSVSSKIGHVFTLMRFLLVSPDIPAETLLADRANFLRSAMERFREAYLFSSEGDEVLRLISTMANYFSFPTSSRVYGYRLGNAEILSSDFGEIKVKDDELLQKLRTGTETLAALAGKTRRMSVATSRRGVDPAGVAKIFSYFDCTDYVDGQPQKGLLTRARNFKAKDWNGGICYLEHINLLWLGRVDELYQAKASGETDDRSEVSFRLFAS